MIDSDLVNEGFLMQSSGVLRNIHKRPKFMHIRSMTDDGSRVSFDGPRPWPGVPRVLPASAELFEVNLKLMFLAAKLQLGPPGKTSART